MEEKSILFQYWYFRYLIESWISIKDSNILLFIILFYICNNLIRIHKFNSIMNNSRYHLCIQRFRSHSWLREPKYRMDPTNRKMDRESLCISTKRPPESTCFFLAYLDSTQIRLSKDSLSENLVLSRVKVYEFVRCPYEHLL